MRVLPFLKAKNGVQFAGEGFQSGGGGGGYTLPVASANTLGGIKVGAGLSINGSGVLSASGGGGGGLPDLSTTEVNTGVKNYDGKDIYMIVITSMTKDNNYDRVISLPGAVYSIINISGHIDKNNGTQCGLNYWTAYDYNDIRLNFYSQLSDNELTGEIVVFYTKNS